MLTPKDQAAIAFDGVLTAFVKLEFMTDADALDHFMELVRDAELHLPTTERETDRAQAKVGQALLHWALTLREGR